ncbi:hypothetical protein ACWCW7_21975 [Nocardia tengchongensis]
MSRRAKLGALASAGGIAIGLAGAGVGATTAGATEKTALETGVVNVTFFDANGKPVGDQAIAASTTYCNNLSLPSGATQYQVENLTANRVILYSGADCRDNLVSGPQVEPLSVSKKVATYGSGSIGIGS